MNNSALPDFLSGNAVVTIELELYPFSGLSGVSA
jgi:hypothetical protein